MVGYLALIENPEPLPIFLLQGIAVLMTAIIYVAFVVLLRLPFSPGFAAYTFPMAIGATAQLSLAGYLRATGGDEVLAGQVHALGVVELWVATIVIGYVCVRYLQFAWQHWRDAHSPEADI
jgi:tellurite resistance protein TehA-like permease